jgi:hypothetical protein
VSINPTTVRVTVGFASASLFGIIVRCIVRCTHLKRHLAP